MTTLTSQLILSLIDKVTAPSRGIAAAVDNLQGRLAENNRRLDAMRGQLFGAAAAGYALFRGLSAPINAAADFEAAMNRVEAASGATAEQTAELSLQAREYGRTTRFTATESALAQEMLAKNGLAVTDILDGATDASLKLAAASGSELAAAADLVTDVMLNFKKQATELGNVADGVTGVMLVSKFGFDDYRLALAQAGGVAGGVGVTLDDFNATIAATSSRFASGSDAGTSFKTFLQRLVPASNPAAKAMKNLGLEFFDAQGKMKPMAAIAEELKQGFKGLSDEARNEALSTIFGTDALRTAIGLMDAGAAGVEQLNTTIKNASADQQAAARMKGFRGEVLKFQSATEGLNIALGTALLPTLTSIVQGMTDLLGPITAFAEANPQLTATLVALTAGLVGLRVAAIAARFALLWTSGGALMAGIAGLRTLGVAARGTAAGLGLIKAAATGGAARAVAIEAAAGARAMLAQKTAAYQSALAMRNLAAAGSVAGVSLKDANTALSSAGREVVAAQAAMAAASAQMRATGPAARSAAAGMMLVRGAATAIKIALIGTGIGAVLVAIGSAGAFIYQNWQGIQAMFAGIAEGIKAAFPGAAGVIDTVSAAVSSLFGWFQKLTGPIDATNEEWRAFGLQVGTTVGEIISTVAGLPGRLIAILSSIDLTGIGRDIMNGLLSGIKAGAAAVLDYVSDVASRIKSSVANAASGAWSSVKSAVGLGSAPQAPALAGARAAGGPVVGGRTYLVGEEGPELFTAPRSGEIIPNGAPAPNAGGPDGGGPVSISFGDIIIQNASNADQIAQDLGRRLREELAGGHWNGDYSVA
jgi:TP901 family phage tail tape measure protein